jgi:hypothetical protein
VGFEWFVDGLDGFRAGNAPACRVGAGRHGRQGHSLPVRDDGAGLAPPLGGSAVSSPSNGEFAVEP